MTTVFIAGSLSISRLHEKVAERITKVVASDLAVVVGDADGADTSIQRCLQLCRATKVTVYCAGAAPRNNVADWTVRRVPAKARAGSRAFFTAKDLEMARHSDYGLMIWDCKSTGTLSNIIELLRENKKSAVFINDREDFITVADKGGFNHLLGFMSDHARQKAEEIIGLSAKLAELDQLSMDISGIDRSADRRTEPAEHAADQACAATAQTESLKLRCTLMSALKEYISRAQLSQSQAARMFGVTQPRVSDLTRGKVELFGLDALVNMASKAGLRVEMHLHDAA